MLMGNTFVMLRFESAAFAEWTEKINRMQEAAEAVLAYLKGDD